MIYTRLTVEAMKLAYHAHHGQTDKAGIPYIFHPYHLAEQMTDECSTCVALLHDVVEDTHITLDELKTTFPKEVTDAVALMTHQKNVPYLEYVKKIASNPIAKAVKLADIRHNSDSTRIPNADDATLLYYAEKYRRAIQVLEEGE
jgi:(p)ppGpp synthase/HD superfamily hydrolase